jgi:hypothetical protein
MYLERTRYWAALSITLAFFGCAHFTREGIIQRASEKASSFEGISEKEVQLPEGYSELVIKASIKIPKKNPISLKRDHLGMKILNILSYLT